MSLFLVFVFLCTATIITGAPAETNLDAILDNVGVDVKYGVIPPAQPFIDRPTELDSIKVLHQDKRFVVLTGPRGVGKTEIARKYAENYKSGSIIWINSTTITQMVADFKAIHSQNIGPVDDTRKITSLIRGVFDHFKTKRTLYVFDGAHSDNILLKQLNNYIKEGDPSLVIITSRNDDWGNLFLNVPVNVFSKPDAVKYIKIALKDLQIPTDESKCEELARELSYLPLALKKSTDYIVKQNGVQKYTIDDFIYEMKHGSLPTTPTPTEQDADEDDDDWKKKIAEEAENLGQKISSGATNAWEKVSSGATHVGQEISSGAKKAGQEISRVAQNIGHSVKNNAQFIIDNTGSTTTQLLQEITNINQIASQLPQKTTKKKRVTSKGPLDFFSNTWETTVNQFDKLGTKITNQVSNFDSNVIVDGALNAFETAQNGAVVLQQELSNTLSTGVKKPSGNSGSIWENIKDGADNLGQNVANGFSSIKDTVTNIDTSNIQDNVANSATYVWDNIKYGANNIGQIFSDNVPITSSLQNGSIKDTVESNALYAMESVQNGANTLQQYISNGISVAGEEISNITGDKFVESATSTWLEVSSSIADAGQVIGQQTSSIRKQVSKVAASFEKNVNKFLSSFF